jgi:hypothetical protein
MTEVQGGEPEAPAVEVPKPPFGDNSFPEEEPTKSPTPDCPIPTGLSRQTIRYLIDTRWLEVYNNSALLTDRTHRMDQSDIFYPMRKMLYGKGYNVDSLSEEQTRGKLYSYIKEYCEKRGIKRHEIGIFAADRAVMAYRGELYSISFENFKQLARHGVDVICIEKEGIVEKLAPFTENIGIALVQSQGFVSEYGIMLVHEARRTGANAMILTDYDSDGIKIAYNVEGITRIGIDFSSVNEINALIRKELGSEDEEDKSEEDEPEAPPAYQEEEDESVYKPDMDDLDPAYGEIEELELDELVEGRGVNDNWTSLSYLTQGLKRKSISNHKLIPIKGTRHEKLYIDYLNQKHSYNREQITNLEFLEENRIELNTIMTEIGAKRFWNWLYSKIIELFPTRNYARVIPVPPYEITLPVLDRLNSLAAAMINESIKYEKRNILNGLYFVRGHLNIDEKMYEIDDRLNDKKNANDEIIKLDKKLKKVVKSTFGIDVN